MDNRFLDMDQYLKQVSGQKSQKKGSGSMYGSALALWESPFSVSDRVLVILIENSGIDLGIPTLVDKLWAALPGTSMIPDEYRQKLVDYLSEKIKSYTDSLLESAELAANRYTAAKPDLFGDVVVLRDGTSSYQDLKGKLLALARDGKIVDLLILTHGGDDSISVPGGINGQKIRAMKTENGKPLTLRSVYMMNCVGSSLNQAWIDAGAKVSSGSLRNNYLPEPTTFFFWQNWKEGQSFENAMTGAYRKTINLMNDTVRGFINQIPGGGLISGSIDFENMDFVKDSAPVIQGQRSVTVSSDDLTFTQSMSSSSLATTVLPVRALRAFSLSQSDGGAPRQAGALSQAGLDLIKGFEGFVPKLYNDPVGHCTVGYGTLVHTGNCDGSASEAPYASGVTEEQATQLLANKAAGFQKVINDNVSVDLNQNQNDALVSFAYNVGAANFRQSSLLRLLNQGNYAAVPGELKKWTKARQNGVLVDLPGLVNRRNAEADLFQKPVTAATQSIRALPVLHSYSYQSPSYVSRGQSLYSLAQNPAAAVIAGIEVADAAQIGLAAVSIVQAQVSASQGSFSLSYDKAQRLLTTEARASMPGSQSAKRSYSQRLFYIGIDRLNTASADVIIEWEGNAYGEIGTPVIRRNLSTSTEWSKSSCNITITKVDRIPLPKTDPRTWPITYTYEGTYDPIGNGYFEFSGEFEVNAFGGIKWNRHEVVSRALADWALSGKPDEYVRKGEDLVVAVPDIPQEQINYLRTKLP
jgi:GH24 family phage-related lysozyme (muramidase)